MPTEGTSLEATPRAPDMDRLSAGIVGLDEMIEGGFPRPSVVIVDEDQFEKVRQKIGGEVTPGRQQQVLRQEDGQVQARPVLWRQDERSGRPEVPSEESRHASLSQMQRQDERDQVREAQLPNSRGPPTVLLQAVQLRVHALSQTSSEG